SELDPFTVYVPPAQQEAFDRILEGTFKGVGVQLNQLDDGRVEVVTPIDGSPAAKAGVMAGDIILKVNGESLDGLRLGEITNKVAGPLGSEVRLTVRHTTGEEAEITMTRQEVVLPTVKGYSRRDDNTWDYFICEDPKIAYLRITQFTPDTFANFRGTVEALLSGGMQGLILDLRFNPGGRLDQALRVLDLLVDQGTLLVTRGRNRPESRIESTRTTVLPFFPMIVLVNEHSASASEVVAGSLMDNKRALVIGERSYGKGSVQEVIPLDDHGGELKLTVAYYYLPSGRLVHRKKDATDWGVQPHIVVPMDPASEIRLARDNSERDHFHRPVTRADAQPTTAPSTQPLFDVQLQRALDTMVATILLGGERRITLPPSTAPAVTFNTDRFVPEEPDSTAGPDNGPATKPARPQQEMPKPAPLRPAPTTLPAVPEK
ncbi:MAG: S41 family peptidase, partial [Tepidisphaeraceae bacterium]